MHERDERSDRVLESLIGKIQSAGLTEEEGALIDLVLIGAGSATAVDETEVSGFSWTDTRDHVKELFEAHAEGTWVSAPWGGGLGVEVSDRLPRNDPGAWRQAVGRTVMLQGGY